MSQHTGSPSALADAFVNALNAHDASELGQLLAENVTYWEANLPSPITGRMAVENHFRENWKSFPDAKIQVVNRVASGDWVVDEVTWSGTNKGPIVAPGQTIPATGKRAQGPAVGVAKVEMGKISQMKIYYDNMSYLAQLGLMPGAGQE